MKKDQELIVITKTYECLKVESYAFAAKAIDEIGRLAVESG